MKIVGVLILIELLLAGCASSGPNSNSIRSRADINGPAALELIGFPERPAKRV
jgi:hypothetical protein